MSDTNLNDASFTPEIQDSEESTNKQTYSATGSFRFWCQKVLPLVYDDSLSYYELLCKVVNYLNSVIQNVDNLNTSVDNTNTAFNNLQNYVNTTKDTLVEVYGELEQYVNDYFNNLDVQEEINSKLDSMAEGGSLSTIISPFIPAIVSDWLSNNITPTSPAIDTSLSVSGAGADAKVTGDRLSEIECPNLMGANLLTLYPVYIKSGEKITISTSDGLAFDGTNRLYFYDINRNIIDWHGLYASDGSKKTFSVDNDIYYLSWYTKASTTQRYMVNMGDKPLPYVEYYNNPKRYGYKGMASNPLSDIRIQGYYTEVNYDGTIMDLPDNYGDWQNGMLEVYSIGISNRITVQKLLNGSGKTWVRTINTQTGAIGQWVQYALNDDVVTDTNTIRFLLHNARLSMSGNYFDRENAEWQEGFINPDGTVNASTGYHYAYARLHGAGEYVRVIRYDNFGTNALNIQLYDVNKTYIKTKAGTRVGVTNSVAFTLTEEEARSAAYTVINVKDEYMFVCGLFFESDNYNYIGLRTPNANFGETTNLLYKKTLVCDGDSICAATLDKPYEENGWFGRLKNSYSMTGKNYGVSGGTITAEMYLENGSKRHWISTSIDTIKEEYPNIDYLIIDGGTNDADLIGSFNNDTPPAKFGTWSETDFSGNYDNTTFCGALDSLFYKAVTYYPTAKIGFIVAMEMGTNNSTIANRRRYFDEATKIATKWHIPVLDLWKEIHADARLVAYYDSTMTEGQNVSAKKFYNDGQHPTSYGYDLMQERIDSWVHSL